MKKRLKIVLDANWYVSACISCKSRRTLYYSILKNSHLQVYYSSELLSEFDAVMVRPKFTKLITARQVNRFKAIILRFLKKTEIITVPAISRDADDNYLLGICKGCQADFLITGDQDLLILGLYNQTKILTMGQFLQLISDTN